MRNASPERASSIMFWKKSIIMIFLAALLSFIFFSGFKHWLSILPADVIEADAGFKKAKHTIDPEKLRAWALNEIAKPRAPFGSIQAPDYITRLYAEAPEDVSVADDSGGHYLKINWGGGFFHWVFYIGATNFTMPTNPMPDDTYTIAEWVPGIYYGREDTLHKIQ